MWHFGLSKVSRSTQFHLDGATFRFAVEGVMRLFVMKLLVCAASYLSIFQPKLFLPLVVKADE